MSGSPRKHSFWDWSLAFIVGQRARLKLIPLSGSLKVRGFFYSTQLETALFLRMRMFSYAFPANVHVIGLFFCTCASLYALYAFFCTWTHFFSFAQLISRFVHIWNFSCTFTTFFVCACFSHCATNICQFLHFILGMPTFIYVCSRFFHFFHWYTPFLQVSGIIFTAYTHFYAFAQTVFYCSLCAFTFLLCMHRFFTAFYAFIQMLWLQHFFMRLHVFTRILNVRFFYAW